MSINFLDHKWYNMTVFDNSLMDLNELNYSDSVNYSIYVI